MTKNLQLSFLESQPKAYGGDLLKTRKGRKGPRPLDTRHTIHLVLRSSRAKGSWSFKKPENERKIRAILDRFSRKNGIRIHQQANVRNHLHLQIKLSTRQTYKPFIRAITSAIAMAVTGASRWKRIEGRFWDRRPFTRVVIGRRAYLALRDYIRVNILEGSRGYDRVNARLHAWKIFGAPRAGPD